MAYFITARVWGRAYYLNSDLGGGRERWTSSPRRATVYMDCRQAADVLSRFAQRMDWPEWARDAVIAPYVEVPRVDGHG